MFYYYLKTGCTFHFVFIPELWNEFLTQTEKEIESSYRDKVL